MKWRLSTEPIRLSVTQWFVAWFSRGAKAALRGMFVGYQIILKRRDP